MGWAVKTPVSPNKAAMLSTQLNQNKKSSGVRKKIALQGSKDNRTSNQLKAQRLCLARGRGR